MLTNLILLFKGENPSIPHFLEATHLLSEQEKMLWRQEIFRLALSGWTQANKNYRHFFKSMIVAYRQQFIDYYHAQTVMGELAFPVGEPDTMILFSKLWYEYEGYKGAPFRQLAFNLSLSFEQHYSLKSICTLSSAQMIDPGDLLDIYARARIGNC
ncbi:hypothetical protein M2133_001751 [Parabacteroides sp. PF5-6]|nr:hypothetical protein [Parabacteroides sp. PF5-6]